MIAPNLKWLILILVAWATLLVVRAIPVGGHWRPLSPETILLLSGGILMYSVGYIIGTIILRSRVRHQPPTFSADAPVLLLSAIAATGALLVSYEFAIVRGYGLDTSVADIRVIEVAAARGGSDGSWISGLGRAMTPALLVAWVAAIQSSASLRSATWVTIWAATALVTWQQGMFEGGRFFTAALLLCIGLSWHMRRPDATGPSLRRSRAHVALLLAAVAAAIYFAFVFVDRARAADLDFIAAYELFSSSFDVRVDSSVHERLGGNAAASWFALTMLWHYCTQSLNELQVMLQQPSMSHAWGSYQFPQLAQALDKMAGVGVTYDVYANLLNPGTYVTLVGAAYVDFGVWGSILFCAALGTMTGYAVKQAQKPTHGRWSLITPTLLAIGVFSPIVSLVTTVWPALLWAVIVRPSRRRLTQSHRVQTAYRAR